MEQYLRKLINDYSIQNIGKEEFLNSFPKELLYKRSLPKKLIKSGLNKNNPEEIDLGYTLMLIQNNLLSYSIDIDLLCSLLHNNIHYHHEDIAMLLRDIQSPNTVDCLYKAAELQFDYLDYDDTYQFARKCIKALAAIGDENAIDKIKLLVNSQTKEISEYAKKELRYKGLL